MRVEAHASTRFFINPGGGYVFTQHNDFYRNAVAVGGFEEVYRDEECAVLRIAD